MLWMKLTSDASDTPGYNSQAVVDLPCNAKIFISSRAEDAIRNTFVASSGMRTSLLHLPPAMLRRFCRERLKK
jgi:hypothetical protein